MDRFPFSNGYFSKDTNSQGSSSTVTPWNWAIPRTVPSMENMPFSDEDAMNAPPPYNYTHLPSPKTERPPVKSSISDDFILAVEKTAGHGRRSRFSEFFRWNPSTASNTPESGLTSPYGEDSGLAGFDHTYSTTAKDIWSMDKLHSAIQPTKPSLSNLVPFLERSIWQTSSEEMARHIRTTSEEKQYRKQLAPIGTPMAPKPSTPNQPQSDLFAQIALSEQEIREVLSTNWEAPTPNPLTGREVTWLMRLHDGKQALPNNNTPAASTQPATAHSRNVSTDSSRGSLSPETSSSMIVSAATSSPATSTSTVAQAQAKLSRGVRFSNAEAQAQQQREIDIATMKEQRAREAVLRPPMMPSVAPAAAMVPASVSALVPMPMPMTPVRSRLPSSTAAAPPFVPTVDGTGVMASEEGPLGFGDAEWVSLLGRRILDLQLQGALEMADGSEEEQ